MDTKDVVFVLFLWRQIISDVLVVLWNYAQNPELISKDGVLYMSEPCRSICQYYDAESKFRQEKNEIFKKYCSTCNLSLISRYSRCPCCHSQFTGGK